MQREMVLISLQLYGQLEQAVTERVIPPLWKRKHLVGFKTVYQAPTDMGDYFVSLYDGSLSKQGLDPVDEAWYEVEAMQEHLTLLGRDDDAAQIQFIAHNERAAVIMPWLGVDVSTLMTVWSMQGLPEDKRPVLPIEFNHVYAVTRQATHVNGDAGWYNLMWHPRKGLCFIDMSSSGGTYSSTEGQLRNLSDAANYLLFPWEELPEEIRGMQNSKRWENRLLVRRLGAGKLMINHMLDTNSLRSLATFGVRRAYHMPDLSKVVLYTENAFYYVDRTESADEMQTDRNMETIAAWSGNEVFIWGDDASLVTRISADKDPRDILPELAPDFIELRLPALA